VSFPGGRCEPSDADPSAAALREAEEEIGLSPHQVEVIGYLPDHLIISGYRVTPVVGLIRPPLTLTLDQREVTSAFEVPLQFVLDPRNHVPRQREFQGEHMELIDLPYGEHNIWGATAGMLLTFRRLLLGEDR
jgi:8-oxo-dGTP pyrophosphatase MutT (NUDIX family)